MPKNLRRQNISKADFIALLLRKSCGFCRGASMYRGVSKFTRPGKLNSQLCGWQARLTLPVRKFMYIRSFDTEKKAAMTYDLVAIKVKGINVFSNCRCFCISSYNESAWWGVFCGFYKEYLVGSIWCGLTEMQNLDMPLLFF